MVAQGAAIHKPSRRSMSNAGDNQGQQPFALNWSPQGGPNKRNTSPPQEISDGGGHSRRPSTTFLSLKSEDELFAPRLPPASVLHTEDHNYGIQSLESTASAADDLEPETDDVQNAGIDEPEGDARLAAQIALHPSPGSSTPSAHLDPPTHPILQQLRKIPVDSLSRPASVTTFFEPLTPLYLNSPSAGTDCDSNGTPRTSSLRSLRLSDDDAATDDGISQAIASSDEEEDVEPESTKNLPQLVMPSIRMPTRRPFTDRGRNLGKLRLAVAGAPGIGKSSLIRSIVQCCEDIVHVDPLDEHSRPFPATQPSAHSKIPENADTIEFLASTRAYPPWWSDFDDGRGLRRRKSSISERVLERNICFIDTPSHNSAKQSMVEKGPNTAIIRHVETLLKRSLSFSTLTHGETLNIMSGNGGPQVDLVLYLLSVDITDSDLDALKRLTELTTVVPVLAKADTIAEADVPQAIASIHQKLQASSIRLANLDLDGSEHSTSAFQPYIWPISSAAGRDDDLMDASLLMSSQYVEPLAASKLGDLVGVIFNENTTAWLRHASAKKLLTWRRLNPVAREASSDASIVLQKSHLLSADSSLLQPTSQTLVPSPGLTGAVSPYTAARIKDHTQREERQAQVHLARWAADLQRSLRNERERFQKMQKEEQRGWLIRKWEESSREMNPGEKLDLPPTGMRGAYVDYRDPLGLLAWDDTIRARGVFVAKVLGSCGMVGAVIIWTMRAWGLGFEGGEKSQSSLIWGSGAGSSSSSK